MKKKVENITIVCDNCGERFVNGDGFTCFSDDPDGGYILSEATSSGWLDIDGRQYCEDCWHYDDEGNIVCSDGRKYDANTHEPVIESVNAADGTAEVRELKDITADIDKMHGEKRVIDDRLRELYIERGKRMQYDFEQEYGLKRGDLVELRDGKHLYYDFVGHTWGMFLWVYCRKPKKDGSPSRGTTVKLPDSFIDCKIIGHQELP